MEEISTYFATDGESLKCACGHIFVDIYDYWDQKGRLVRDQDETRFELGIVNDLLSLLDAIREGEKQNWTREKLGKYISPDISLDILFRTVVGNRMLECELRVFECPNCTRLFIESDPGSNYFRCYTAEGRQDTPILRSNFYNKSS